MTNAAAQTLEDINFISANKILRLESIIRKDGVHINKHKKGMLAASRQITLIESDFFDDAELLQWLYNARKFDAITLWLCGSHKERQFCYSCRNINNSAENRLFTQNMAYKLANKILKIGGILHILDRVSLGETDRYKNEIIWSHQKQAIKTTLQPASISSRPYDLPTDTRGITFTGSLKNDTIKPQRIELQSLIFVKS